MGVTEPTKVIKARQEGNLIIVDLPDAAMGNGGIRKEWVGLTDDEIKVHLIDWTAGWTYVDFAKAIEAKLKEKNEIR